MAHAAAEHAPRYAWPHVAAEVLGAYEDAIEIAAAAPVRGIDGFAVRDAACARPTACRA